MENQGGVRGGHKRSRCQGGGLIGRRIGQYGSLCGGAGGKNENPTHQRGESSKRGGHTDPANRGGHFFEPEKGRAGNIAGVREQGGSERPKSHIKITDPEGVQSSIAVPGSQANNHAGKQVHPTTSKEPHARGVRPGGPGSRGRGHNEIPTVVDSVNRSDGSHVKTDGPQGFHGEMANSTTNHEHYKDVSSRSASFDKFTKVHSGPHTQLGMGKKTPYVTGQRKPDGLPRGYRGLSAAGGAGQAEAIGSRPVTAGQSTTTKPSAQVNTPQLSKGLRQNRIVEETSIRMGGGPILDNETKANHLQPGAERPRPCSVAKNFNQQNIGGGGMTGENKK